MASSIRASASRYSFVLYFGSFRRHLATSSARSLTVLRLAFDIVAYSVVYWSLSGSVEETIIRDFTRS